MTYEAFMPIVSSLLLALPIVAVAFGGDRSKVRKNRQTDLPDELKTRIDRNGFALCEKEFSAALCEYRDSESPDRPLSDFEPKKLRTLEPPPMPIVKPDPLAALKRQLRSLTYGEFIEAATGLGFDPPTAWKWATA